MDNSQEMAVESGKALKYWSAPKLIEADIADMTEQGLNTGIDGSGSTSTLS